MTGKAEIDLHVHTTASDGVHSPTEVVKMAKKIGLKALGVADHDTIDGLPEAMRAGKKYGVEIVPGVEITNYWSEQNRREFHILGYYCDSKNKKLNDTFKHYQQIRLERAKKIVQALQKLGWQVTFEQVQKIAGGAIGRPHPARAVLQNPANKTKLKKVFGKIPALGEFIEAYIIRGKPAYFPKAGLEPDETIALIHQAGGLAVLAHPGWNLKPDEEWVLKQLVVWKLDGIEVIHSKRSKKETLQTIRRYVPLAKKYNLLVTAGSDFHGSKPGEPGNELGMLKWQIEMPYELLEKMKEAVKITPGV